MFQIKIKDLANFEVVTAGYLIGGSVNDKNNFHKIEAEISHQGLMFRFDLKRPHRPVVTLMKAVSP